MKIILVIYILFQNTKIINKDADNNVMSTPEIYNNLTNDLIDTKTKEENLINIDDTNSSKIELKQENKVLNHILNQEKMVQILNCN